MEEPTVGRIVHYVSHGTPGGEFGKECRAAIVTEVIQQPQPDFDTPAPPPVLGLAVVNPTGMFFNQQCVYDGGPAEEEEERRNSAGPWDYAGGTWHWPERVG